MERETFALVDNLSTVENSDGKWRKNQELFFALLLMIVVVGCGETPQQSGSSPTWLSA
jgi:Tfp pilus assembly protein PilO